MNHLNDFINWIESHPAFFGGICIILGSIITFVGAKIKKGFDHEKPTDSIITIYNQIGISDKKRLLEGTELSQPSNNKQGIMIRGFSLLPFNRDQISFSQENIKRIGDFFNKVFKKKQSGRNGFTMLQGAIFALGTRELENPEWMEHCASSLRELFHEWDGVSDKINSAFLDAFSTTHHNLPKNKVEPEMYRKLHSYYLYFSSLCHHNKNDCVYSLRELFGEDVKDNTEELFLQAVRDYLILLNDFEGRSNADGSN